MTRILAKFGVWILRRKVVIYILQSVIQNSHLLWHSSAFLVVFVWLMSAVVISFKHHLQSSFLFLIKKNILSLFTIVSKSFPCSALAGENLLYVRDLSAVLTCQRNPFSICICQEKRFPLPGVESYHHVCSWSWPHFDLLFSACALCLSHV